MKTSELTGAALDWAVAKCEGATNLRHDTVATWWVDLNGIVNNIAIEKRKCADADANKTSQ